MVNESIIFLAITAMVMIVIDDTDHIFVPLNIEYW